MVKLKIYRPYTRKTENIIERLQSPAPEVTSRPPKWPPYQVTADSFEKKEIIFAKTNRQKHCKT
jgi:hypothetical protein